MSGAAFCTRCGAARAADARFCTGCGAPADGGAAPAQAPRPAAPAARPAAKAVTAPALGVAALLLAAGSAAVFFALQTPADAPRAVPGSPGAPAGARQGGQAGQAGELPQGHPSIELPKEVVDFLDGLTAEADKDPKNVETAQKLARARYRASALNESYRVSAEQAVARLLALDPANVEGMRLSANLAYDAGRFDEAEKRFRAFLEKTPDDVSAITDLGSVLLFQDRLDDAIASYRSAIAKDAKFLQAHFNLGIALQKQGKKDEALASLRRANELADTPEQKKHIEGAIAELEGRAPAPAVAAAPPQAPPPSGAPAAGAPAAGGMPMPPPAPERDVATNASTDFQRAAQKPLVTHPIVGPRVVGFEWTGPTALRVRVADFPMDQMPPFARSKFKTSLGEKLGALAKENGLDAPVTAEIVDAASGRVMDTVDSSAGAGSPR